MDCYQSDLKDESLEDAEDTWLTDASRLVRQGNRKAGYAGTVLTRSPKHNHDLGGLSLGSLK